MPQSTALSRCGRCDPGGITELQSGSGRKGPQEIIGSNPPAKPGSIQQVTQVGVLCASGEQECGGVPWSRDTRSHRQTRAVLQWDEGHSGTQSQIKGTLSPADELSPKYPACFNLGAVVCVARALCPRVGSAQRGTATIAVHEGCCKAMGRGKLCATGCAQLTNLFLTVK